jgi:uncharacterized protein
MMIKGGKQNTRYTQLLDSLSKFGSAAVAFSGGTDSTFLLLAAREALGSRMLALTVKTPYIPDWELEESAAFCRGHGIPHKIIPLAFSEVLRNNPVNRCYLCKRHLFEKVLAETTASGMNALLEGTNADDLTDYRPGMKALAELDIKSPLLEAGFSKAEIRELSHALGLQTWNKPAYSCLMTRLPYDQPVLDPDFARIEKAELFMMEAGYRSVRVRVQGETARIEISPEDIPGFISSGRYKEAAAYFKTLGFHFISLDLEGYRRGSYNTTIEL